MDIILKLKLRELQSLPVEELVELYQGACEEDKQEIIRLVKKNASEFISDTKSILREINLEIQRSKLSETA